MFLERPSLQAPGRTTKSLAELAELLRALQARDREAAQEAAVRHVGNAAEAAIALLREEEAPPA